jgi:hypothetical protein
MKNLIKSLSAFQNECPIIHKDTKGHNYTYADLPQIFNTINPLMKKHGLCFSQLLEDDGIRTILFHVESGEQLESFTLIPKVKLGNMNDYQAYGSGVTYFRRYAISAILGLVTDKDTDAAGTQNNLSLTNKDLKELESILNECQSIDEVLEVWSNLEDYCKKNKVVRDIFSDRKNQLNK